MNPQSVLSQLSPSRKRGLSWVTRRLSIRQKISCGYALALGVAVLGTTAGIVIGEHYQQQAREQEQDAIEEILLVQHLETSLLLAQSHQQHLVASEPEPERLGEEYTHFLKHAAEASQLWSKLKSSYRNEAKELPAELEVFNRLVQNYDDFLKAYFQQTEILLEKMESPNSNPKEIEVARKFLVNLNNSVWHLQLEGITNDLNELTHAVSKEYEQAKAKGVAADEIRLRVISASILLSVTIAILLGIYISRAIAHPIQVITKVAKRVSQEENFSLQAPVTTGDEVGELTSSLNQLIQRVNQLLEDQNLANQAHLIQAEKMSSLGQMLAGVAHEITNPINFIYGNSVHARNYVEDLLILVKIYESEIPHSPQAVRVHAEEIDLDFLKEDLPKLLDSMQVGAERATQIIFSLKDFARLDEEKPYSVDLHACIDSTLIILNNRIKKQISVIQNYGDIPAIEGYAGLLYQVFMNLLSNAIDALEESKGEKQITITTQLHDDDWVIVKIADNGSGIALENQDKIFDAFFTTKPRGVGTGLGLAISHQIIAEKHGGKLSCQSEVGVGTEFAIALPIKHNSLVESSDKNFLLATSA